MSVKKKAAKKKIVRETIDRETPVAVPMQELVIEKYGSRLSTAVVCKFCKHSYLKPCKDDKAKSKCRNWQHLEGKL